MLKLLPVLFFQSGAINDQELENDSCSFLQHVAYVTARDVPMRHVKQQRHHAPHHAQDVSGVNPTEQLPAATHLPEYSDVESSAMEDLSAIMKQLFRHTGDEPPEAPRLPRLHQPGRREKPFGVKQLSQHGHDASVLIQQHRTHTAGGAAISESAAKVTSATSIATSTSALSGNIPLIALFICLTVFIVLWLVNTFTTGAGFQELLFVEGVSVEITRDLCYGCYACAVCCYQLDPRTHLLVLLLLVFMLGGLSVMWELGWLQPILEQICVSIFLVICAVMALAIVYCELRHVILTEVKPIVHRLDQWVHQSAKAVESTRDAAADHIENVTGVDLFEFNNDTPATEDEPNKPTKDHDNATAKTKPKKGCC
jgi:hypothetical protein